jgi:putative transcriptional regulator
VDWEAVDRTTDEEIDAQIAEDPDLSPIWTKEDFARATLVRPKVDAGDVRGIRNRLHLSQEQFAKRFGFSVETIRNYEQGHRRPRGPASVLLRVIASEPDAVERALAK